MNIVDLALFAILLIAGIGGFFRGFVQSVLAIAAWVAAVFITMYGFPYASEFARKFISLRIAADAAAGLALFVVSLVILSLIRHQISAGVRHSALSALDRSLGFVFGLLFGVVLVCLLYFGAARLMGPQDQWPDWAREAKSLPVVERVTAGACALGPASVRDLCRGVLGRGPTPEDIERQFERLNAPPTRGGQGDSQPGYTDRQRRGLDRLIEQNR
jgi:membrane protein required for colicin V production